MKSLGAPQLVLADTHTLEPYTVQGFQFLSRAASFAEHWPGRVQLWLPGPAISDTRMLAATGTTRWPENFQIKFGPPPVIRLGPIRIKSKGTYRSWVATELGDTVERDSRPTALYFRTLKLASALRPLMRKLSVPYFFEPHEVFFESAKDPQTFRAMEKEVYEDAAHLYSISSGLAGELEKEFGIGKSITVAPLGHSGANLSLQLYDPSAEPRLLYTGSLLRWKGLETVLNAAHTLEIPFDVVGDAGGKSFYEEYAREHGFTRTLFHGHVLPEQLSKYYHPGSIPVLPLSRANIAMKYTSPLKLFEYLASARPVVAGDVPSVREIVENRKHALLLEPENLDAWIHGLRGLLNDRRGALAMAERGRELARSFTWSARAKVLVQSLLAQLQ